MGLLSKIFSGVKKVFKGVAKVVKKILPAALAIGAVVFTAGAALGLPAMAGGFGGLVSSGLSAVGISGTGAIGGMLTGAVTQAGYGAAIGGLTSMAAGGSFTQGATAGALTGAVSGGIMGGMGMATDPLAKLTGNVAGGAPGAAVQPAAGTGVVQTPGAVGPATVGAATTGPATAGPAGALTGVTGAPIAAAAPAPVAAAATPAASGGGLFSTLGNVLKSPVAGQAIAGLGQGLMTGLGAKAEAEAAEEDQQRITDSYQVNENAIERANRPTDSGYKRGGAKYARKRRFVYDRNSGQINYA